MKTKNYYWRIARRLPREDLQRTGSEKIEFSEQDLFHLDIGKRGGSFFLGFYSREGIELALSKYGVYGLLREKGFDPIYTDVDTRDPYKHRIALYYQKKHRKNLLIELVVRKSTVKSQMPFETVINKKTYTGLAIDWLCIQNIFGRFSPERPRLPGQKYPGLGLSHVVLELLLIICWRLKLSTLINVPDHYHNAFLYSRMFYYQDPEIEAQFTALKNQFSHMPLEKISWGIDWGCVRHAQDKREFEWIVSRQLIPLEKDLKNVFRGKAYRERVRRRSGEYEFVFDEEKYNACKRKYQEQNLEKCI